MIATYNFYKTDVKFALTAEDNRLQEFFQKIMSESNNREREHLTNFIKDVTKSCHKKGKDIYKKKLRHLMTKNDIPFESQVTRPTISKPKSKGRRFIKKSTYQKWKKNQAMKKCSSLVHNLSDFQLTKPMDTLLSKGLSFVPTTDKLNVTQLKTDIDKYTRTVMS